MWYFKLEFMKSIIIVAYLNVIDGHPCHGDYAVPDGEHRGHQVPN
jgi:hypothetical protein